MNRREKPNKEKLCMRKPSIFLTFAHTNLSIKKETPLFGGIFMFGGIYMMFYPSFLLPHSSSLSPVSCVTA
jgi:hypothetical protein